MNKDPLIKDKVKGKVKLIYIDPPFGTGDEYGGRDGEMSYSAKMMGAEYIENLRERIVYLRELLSHEGAFFIRMDYHFGHYIKVMIDELFGKDNFKNELIIKRGYVPKGTTTRFATATDSLFFYSKNYNFSLEENTKPIKESDRKWISLDMPGQRKNPKIRARIFFGQLIFPPKNQHWGLSQQRISELEEKGDIRINKGRTYVDTEGNEVKGMPEYLKEPFILLNSEWTDIKSYETHNTFYPTENSEELLERVINSCSKPNDLVLDCFAGSGTTGAVAEKLGRRWIMCDFGKHAIYTMQKRIWQIAGSKKLGQEAKKNEKYNIPPKPFAVVSAGAYDFSKIMDLRKNKNTYINFVLGLFGIISEEKDYTAKYKLTNIYAEKENNPVEVFPIWDDDYLKYIKIDEDYLKGIVNAAGGRLKGDYYIITPETCTIVANTTLKNVNNDEVNFILLKFPYKLLEDFSRQMEIEEQPDSADSINRLISSSAFYFNEEVKIKLTKLNNGFQITDLKTNILDKNKNRFKGLDGLSMLLIDKNYDRKVFNLDAAVYKKDITDDGIVKIGGLNNQSAVIAIDKHGNESEITYIS